MQAGKSADGLHRAFRVRAVVRAAHFSAGEKALLLALNAWPAAHVAAAVLLATVTPWTLGWRLAACALWIFLAPPLICRAVSANGLPAGEFDVPTRAFFRWWATWNLQAVFNRLPWIEEAIRLVPGLYSAWLRLWGSRIGKLTLWSPGVRVLDRPFLVVGDNVVVGIDVRLVGHLGGLDSRGHASLTLGPVTLGDRTSVGGGSMLGAGFVLEADQVTEALFLGLPFTRWRSGERVPPTV
jgi:hypothetical protein